MNKLNSGNPITIKINGEKRPYVEEPSKEETQSNLNEDLPIEHDTSKLEHEVIEETAAAQEAEESFDWILPQQETIQNDSSLYQAVTSKQHTGIRLPALSKVEKKNISAIKSMALSVVFAILLGTG
ncbi:MAG: hypothetical protein Q8935_17020, partial [Bacillota bacterium]|nr:hypothetical protein [Bacillota bacterium]